jgi:hypothetical protein
MNDLREITRYPAFLEKAGFVLIYTTREGRFRRPAGAAAIREIARVAHDL